jgi:hypothetical protein
VIGVLLNPNFPGSAFQLKDVQEAAHTLRHPIHVLNASSSSEINTAFATIAQQRIDALLVAGDPFFLTRSYQFIMLAARHAVPTIYFSREFVAGGGLISGCAAHPIADFRHSSAGSARGGPRRLAAGLEGSGISTGSSASSCESAPDGIFGNDRCIAETFVGSLRRANYLRLEVPL